MLSIILTDARSNVLMPTPTAKTGRPYGEGGKKSLLIKSIESHTNRVRKLIGI